MSLRSLISGFAVAILCSGSCFEDEFKGKDRERVTDYQQMRLL